LKDDLGISGEHHPPTLPTPLFTRYAQTSTVYMTSTTSPDSTQIPISFQDPDRPSRNFGWGFGGDGCGIWSCRFSADGQEIVAGGDGKIFGMYRGFEPRPGKLSKTGNFLSI
jgi:hypothetical protein